MTSTRPSGPVSPMPQLKAAARLLRRRAVGQLRVVRLLRVDDVQPVPARQRQQPPAGRHDALQRRHVVAQHRAEAAGLEEVALHVDQHHRGVRRVEAVGVGAGVDASSCGFLQCPRPWPCRCGRCRRWRSAHSSATWPCDSTTRREASASSSSRSSLTSSTPAPASRAARSRAWISALAWKSRPKQGLATISSRGFAVELARQHGALHVAAGQGLDRRVRAGRLDLEGGDLAQRLRAHRAARQPAARAPAARGRSCAAPGSRPPPACRRRRCAAAPRAGCARRSVRIICARAAGRAGRRPRPGRRRSATRR